MWKCSKLKAKLDRVESGAVHSKANLPKNVFDDLRLVSKFGIENGKQDVGTGKLFYNWVAMTDEKKAESDKN